MYDLAFQEGYEHVCSILHRSMKHTRAPLRTNKKPNAQRQGREFPQVPEAPCRVKTNNFLQKASTASRTRDLFITNEVL